MAAPKYANEVLKVINDAKPGKEQEKVLFEYGVKPPINYLLALNFDSRIVVDLPQGMPPYNRDLVTHPDFQGSLAQTIQRLRNCFKSVQLPKFRKEAIFIQMLENCPPGEADVLVHAKDKALHEMYPNITKELVAKVFPKFVA
jgi:hypothetical protein